VYEVEVVVDPLLLEVPDPVVDVLLELVLVVGVLLVMVGGVAQALFEGAETPPLLNALTT
jgi:hypothetical protein